jgi:bifunctional non-homologous end joining protein LigD
LRDDKDSEDVVRETAKESAAKAARVKEVAASKAKSKSRRKTGTGTGGAAARTASDKPAQESSRFPLTHPDRVYWPEIGLTKLGLAEYYDSIADRILPHIAGRPIALMRCPTGIAAQCFFQKHGWDGMPKAIRTVTVDGDEWVYIDNKDGLIALVQSGSLEIHPWGSTVRNIEKPDRVILDFDPGPGVEWTDVVAGAFEARDRLKQYGLQSFVKTTGGKGLHVVAPLTPRLGWDEVKEFSRSIAAEMAADARDRYIATMSKKQRKGRIFIDYLRNGRGNTAVAAFSTRARDGAPVSTPVAWSELGPDLLPNRFTVENLGARLDNLRRDPWAGFFSMKQTIRKRR